MKKPANNSPTAGLSKKKSRKFFDVLANAVTKAAGKPIATITAFLVVLLWAVSGPAFGFSETWQLMINTTTTIITFLMVFIIQQSQNRESIAVQLKLNELIACNEKASNRIVDIEDLSAEELDVLKKFYVKLSELAENEKEIHSSHSIDDAKRIHEAKASQNTRKSKRKATAE